MDDVCIAEQKNAVTFSQLQNGGELSFGNGLNKGVPGLQNVRMRRAWLAVFEDIVAENVGGDVAQFEFLKQTILIVSVDVVCDVFEAECPKGVKATFHRNGNEDTTHIKNEIIDG